VTLLTFNTLSIENLETREEINDLLVQLAYAINKFLTYKENKGSRFYFEEKNIFNLKIIEGYNFGDALKSIKPEISRTLHLFMKQQCNSDCLNKMSDKEIENIIDSNLYFDDEEYNSQKYLILSYSLDKKTFLLSFGKDRWTKYKIIANKLKENGHSEKVILDNIANKEHVIAHYNQKQLDKLPTTDIIYSDNFKDWLLSIDVIHRDKTIEKLQFVASKNFEGRRENNIAPIATKKIKYLKEIIVGSAGGMSYAQIRVFFKPYNEKSLILNGFIKQNESSQDKKYDEEIEIANKIFEDIKKEINEI